MPIIEKPLLAANFDVNQARYPYLATPKIDGIRFLMVGGKALSRSFKPIRNKYIQKLLSSTLPDGIDGELTCGNNFQDSTSGIMSIDGQPLFKAWLFDYIDPKTVTIFPYQTRIENFPNIIQPWAEILNAVYIPDYNTLLEYESFCLGEGFEGVILRDPNGTYKFGRSTNKENIILKVKRFLDDEATIIGYEEKQHNENDAELDMFGRTKRSQSKFGKVNAGTLGKIIVRNQQWGEFEIGSGFNDDLRDKIWNNQNKYLGDIVKYKYLPYGIKDKPRHPVFLGFRDIDDI